MSIGEQCTLNFFAKNCLLIASSPDLPLRAADDLCRLYNVTAQGGGRCKKIHTLRIAVHSAKATTIALTCLSLKPDLRVQSRPG